MQRVLFWLAIGMLGAAVPVGGRGPQDIQLYDQQ